MMLNSMLANRAFNDNPDEPQPPVLEVDKKEQVGPSINIQTRENKLKEVPEQLFGLDIVLSDYLYKKTLLKSKKRYCVLHHRALSLFLSGKRGGIGPRGIIPVSRLTARLLDHKPTFFELLIEGSQKFFLMTFQASSSENAAVWVRQITLMKRAGMPW